MLNYSIYPGELIFEDYDTFEAEYEEIELNDEVRLLVERINNNQLKISQIISSNPNYYLLQEFQPGTILNTTLNLNQNH
ncbi:MAG: hypothetical protein GX175_02930 [Halanaerobiaceae bacterium]|jgi:hypothetical protein|nr:hypothetical protein [Halanaerobiaceae bacterium]